MELSYLCPKQGASPPDPSTLNLNIGTTTKVAKKPIHQNDALRLEVVCITKAKDRPVANLN